MENQILCGRYRVLENLGQGGFGETFLAEDLHLPTSPRCVVKKLKIDNLDADSLAVARKLFEREARVLYALGTHPNIPALMAHFEDVGDFYLVQELIEGETLAEILRGGRILNEHEAFGLLEQILEVLAFVHENAVIHRDLKPQNMIRRRADGKICLIDFGAVKQVSIGARNHSTAQSSIVIGSDGFMPGEQLAGKPRFASDIYAAGLIVIQALTGIHPRDLQQNERTGEFVWQHNLRLTKEFAYFLAKMVRYDFRTRQTSASEALAALRVVRRTLPPLGANNFNAPRVAAAPQIHNSAPRDSDATRFPTAVPRNLAPTRAAAAPNSSQQKTLAAMPVRPFNPSAAPLLADKKPLNLLVGLGVSAAVVGLLFVSLIWIVTASPRSERAESRTPKFPEGTFPIKSTPAAASANDTYIEATKQANEAEIKEFRAKLRHEWNEIAAQWERAAKLMQSVNTANPNHADAEQKRQFYIQKALAARQRANTASDSLPARDSSTASTQVVQTGGSAAPTPYRSGSQTQSFAKIGMPPRYNYRSYLAYNRVNRSKPEGESKIITDADANFVSSVNGYKDNTRDGGSIQVNLSGGSYASGSLTFIAAHGARIQPGGYAGAQSYPWQSPTKNAMSFSQDVCSQQGTRGFNVNEIQYSAAGDKILLFDATFTEECGEYGKLFGRVRYDAR